MALPQRARYTAWDIWDTPDDGNRYEVIAGALYVTPPPIVIHQGAQGELYFFIRDHIRAKSLGGKVFMAPIGVVLDEPDGVQPDLVYVSRERLGIIGEKAIEGAPDLVAEILSPSTRRRDRGIKLQRYAAAGVPHYWILDPRARTIEERVLVNGAYELVGTFGTGSVFRPRLFPGLEIPVDDLWA